MSDVTTVSTVATEVAAPRKVTIISTVGTKKKEIEFPEDLLWGNLKKVVANNGYSLTNIKAVEGGTKVTLEHDKAVLPKGDFFLFLMPYKSKSGATKKEAAPKKVAAKKAAPAKKAAVKKAEPKKATKVAAKKAAPKKVVAKKAAAKKETPAKVTKPRIKKALPVEGKGVAVEPEVTTTNVADVVESVQLSKPEVKILTEAEALDQMRDLAKGFNDVRL